MGEIVTQDFITITRPTAKLGDPFIIRKSASLIIRDHHNASIEYIPVPVGMQWGGPNHVDMANDSRDEMGSLIDFLQ
jgi:hypothetical protein